ncbi:MAG: hypothetical protein JNK82_21430 [Myxococcaceae bacterium]|nr:hypothetical protein [Myxococcaceae bacterium]
MTLADSARVFCSAYAARADLAQGFRGWTKAIALIASDTGEEVVVMIRDGRVLGCESGSGRGDVIITAEAQTLSDVLELKRGANEPYLFGELTVRGAEEDFLRLDYVTSVLGPR